MSLDDLVDRLISEKAQLARESAIPPATGGQQALSPAGSPPASASDIGQSLSNLINKVSADHAAAAGLQNTDAGEMALPSGDLDDETRKKLGQLNHLQAQLMSQQQRIQTLEANLSAKEDEIKRQSEQFNTLKDKTRLLIAEYQKLKEGAPATAGNIPADFMGTPAAAPTNGGQGTAAADFPWRKHLAAVQETLNRKEIAAGETLLKVLIDASAALSAEIPTRLRLMTQMGTIRMESGNLKEAEQIIQESIALMDSANARKSVAGAYCLDALAQCSQLKEDFDSAEKLRREAVVIADDCLGAEHPEASFFRERLESLRQERQMFQMGDDEGSRTILDKLTAEYNQALASGQPPATPDIRPTEAVAGLMFDKYTANAKSALAQKNMRDAESFLRSAMDKAEGIANNDMRKYEGMRLLATALEMQNKDVEAKQLYEQSLALAFKNLGWNDAQVAHSLAALAELHSRINDFGLAKNYFKQAIAAYSVLLGPNDATVVDLQQKYEQFIQRVKEERKWKGWAQ